MLRGPEYKTRYELGINDDDITHVNYFKHRVAELHLNDVLTGRGSDAFREADRPVGTRGRVSGASPKDDPNLPCIILLPGIMGSELSAKVRGDERDVWLDAFQLLTGQGKKLSLIHI